MPMVLTPPSLPSRPKLSSWEAMFLLPSHPSTILRKQWWVAVTDGYDEGYRSARASRASRHLLGQLRSGIPGGITSPNKGANLSHIRMIVVAFKALQENGSV